MQATGDNEQMIRPMGTNTDQMRILGLGLANALVALSGALVAQKQGFADIGMGIGTIVAGLARVIIGEVIFGARSVSWVLFSVIGGSVVYRLLIAVSLRLGYRRRDLRLLTAVLVVAALSVPTVRLRWCGHERKGRVQERLREASERSMSDPASLQLRGVVKASSPAPPTRSSPYGVWT